MWQDHAYRSGEHGDGADIGQGTTAQARGGLGEWSLGLTCNTSAICLRIVTLAETVSCSIDPLYQGLKPDRSASSSCISFRSCRIRWRLIVISSFRSITEQRLDKNDLPRDYRCYR